MNHKRSIRIGEDAFAFFEKYISAHLDDEKLVERTATNQALSMAMIAKYLETEAARVLEKRHALILKETLDKFNPGESR